MLSSSLFAWTSATFSCIIVPMSCNLWNDPRQWHTECQMLYIVSP